MLPGCVRSLLSTSCRLCLLAALGGCAAAGDVIPEVAGLGAGAGAGVLTANPLVGVAVAIGTRFAVAEGVDRMREGEKRLVQKAVAETAGDASPGEVVAWSTKPDVVLDAVFGAESGHLQVLREFGGRIPCRELLYTSGEPEGGVEGTAMDVESDIGIDTPHPAAAPADWPGGDVGPLRVAVICRGGRGWRWAVAQPAPDPSS